MKKMLRFLVSSIVEHPKEITIKENKEGDILNLHLKVNPQDLKIVIGKQGKTVRAIRNLLKAKARKEARRFFLVLEE